MGGASILASHSRGSMSLVPRIAAPGGLFLPVLRTFRARHRTLAYWYANRGGARERTQSLEEVQILVLASRHRDRFRAR